MPPDSWVRIDVDGKTPSLAGPAVSGQPQDYTIKVEPTFLVDGFHCEAACDPENANADRAPRAGQGGRVRRGDRR